MKVTDDSMKRIEAGNLSEYRGRYVVANHGEAVARCLITLTPEEFAGLRAVVRALGSTEDAPAWSPGLSVEPVGEWVARCKLSGVEDSTWDRDRCEWVVTGHWTD